MQRKEKKVSRKIDGKNLKVGIVVSRFNDDITGKMLEGALRILSENSVQEKNIQIVWVPGSFEIPLACQKLAKSRKPNGIVAIGAVIKGDTDHYYYISGETTRGIMKIMLDYSLPIGFGVITTNNLRQAKERSGKTGNKGGEAAEAMLQMIEILKK